jgi:hypothetical protein
MSMIKITISRDDEFTAGSVAFRRALENADKVDRSVQKLGLHDGIARDADSIGAEIAVAQYFGIRDFEPTCGTFKDSADVGSFIEVKHTKWVDGHLIIKESDRNTDIAVLVTGTSPQYFICGWIPVAVAKKDRFKHAKSDSWWVSQINLQPIDTLRKSQYGNASL